MKCRNCESEWHSAGNIKACPFCQADCTMPEDELALLYTEATKIDEENEDERAAAFCRVAEYGYPPALYSYGLCYEEGKGVPKSESNAIVYYRIAALDGHPDSAYRLALLLRRRYFGKPEADVAYFWLRVAAELGVSGARCLLGDCYEKGEGIAANPLRAAYWYTLAAEAGDFSAAYRLVALYHEGRGVKKNPAYEKYYAEIAYNGGVRAAERNIRALGPRVFSEVPARIELKNRNEERFELGFRAYGEGKYKIAVAMYTLAAKDGYARAQNALGVCHENGHGVEKSEDEAVVWYRFAAEGGYDLAFVNLGNCYRYGRGLAKNEENAFACYLTAAENGFAHAQCIVANCYFDAELVARNIPEAMKWYEKAALQGESEAMERINAIRADMTDLYNRGVDAYEKRDYASAVKFYTLAAEFGHRGAQCNLGYCYQNGHGCEKNDRYAVYYYSKAAAQESGTAEMNLALCYLRGEGSLCYRYRVANELLRRAVAHGVPQAEEIYQENITRKKKKMARRVWSMSATVMARGMSELQNALQLRRIAAEMGNGRAMFALGCHYEFGFGVPMDDKIAAAWYERARAAGYRNGSRMKSAILHMIRRPDTFGRKSREELKSETAPEEKPAE